MIAVHADAGDSRVVVEFFELFKTPWEFFRTGGKHDVILCAGPEIPQTDAKLVLIYSGRPTSFDTQRELRPCKLPPGVILSYNGERIPVYENGLTFGHSEDAVLPKAASDEPFLVKFNLNDQSVVRIGYDLFKEVRHLLTQGQTEANARIPALEVHIALLRDLIIGASIPLHEIPPVPGGSKFIACLTHDVDHIGIRNHKFDHTTLGFLYRATIGTAIELCRGRKTWRQLGTNWLAALKLPLVHLGLIDDYWETFDRYLEIERGLHSTFFVIPKKGEPGMDAQGHRPSRRAARYDAAELRESFEKLMSVGDEIALHGIDAWRDSAVGRQEREIIARLTGATEMGVRMHWLYFDEQSPATLEAAGFSYDSTVGYNQTVGFRAGTAQVFKPMATERLLELPMHVMDTAMFYPDYLDLEPAQAGDTIGPLIDSVVRFGGVLTINWHDRSIAPERLWDTAYIRLLEQLRSNGACFLNAAETVAWFRKRRTAVFVQAGGAMTIHTPTGSDARLPGLQLQTFQPGSGVAGFQKTDLPDGAEISLAV